jgi:hypothetical protein
VLFCAEQIARSMRSLPQSAALVEKCQALRTLAQSIEVEPFDLGRLRRSVDDLQRASADLHDAATAQYFAVGTEG